MLLVIFIITTTPVVNDLEVEVPSAAPRAREPKPKVNYVTVEKTAVYLNKDRIDLNALQTRVAALRLENFQRNETQDISLIVRGAAKDEIQEHKAEPWTRCNRLMLEESRDRTAGRRAQRKRSNYGSSASAVLQSLT